MTDTTLEPVMQAVSVPGTISGPGVIDDLCNRIADQLARDCNLRASDCYAGYAFKATIDIQLLDVYPAAISATVAVGAINPQLPVERIAIGAEVSGEEVESSSLERPVDPEGFTPQRMPPQKRGRGRPRKYAPLS